MRKRRKTYSVDAMMRFLLQYYHIPTKQDVDKILKRLDKIEEALQASMRTTRKVDERKSGMNSKETTGRSETTATEKVTNIIKRSPKGIDVAGLKAKSGFEDKKIRNIVFRLTQQGIIKRIGRGMYTMI